MESDLGFFQDSNVGVVMSPGLKWEQRANVDGELYWYVEQPIGSLLGSEVEGCCSGIGRTKEEAFAHLREDITKLGDSIWE